MLASVTRYFTAPVTSRAYNTVSGAFRARLTRGTTRAADHNTGRGTAAFNEREAALENKAVKDQEFLNLQRSKEDAKKAADAPVKATRAPRNSGLKAAAAAGTSAEVEALQKQIDALQSQLNKIKK